MPRGRLVAYHDRGSIYSANLGSLTQHTTWPAGFASFTWELSLDLIHRHNEITISKRSLFGKPLDPDGTDLKYVQGATAGDAASSTRNLKYYSYRR